MKYESSLGNVPRNQRISIDEVFGTYRMLMVQGLLDLATDVRPITDVATKSIRQFSAMTRCVGGRLCRAVSSSYCSLGNDLVALQARAEAVVGVVQSQVDAHACSPDGVLQDTHGW